MTSKQILVHMTDPDWTMTAMHLACALARHTGSEVALLRLIPVDHAQWLGTDLGNRHFSPKDLESAKSYLLTAQDYNVCANLYKMQYLTLHRAIIEAAMTLSANIVFASIPHSSIPYFRTLNVRLVRRQLAKINCTLYTLDRPAGSTSMDWTPSLFLEEFEQNVEHKHHFNGHSREFTR
jgi:hypothetical protein